MNTGPKIRLFLENNQQVLRVPNKVKLSDIIDIDMQTNIDYGQGLIIYFEPNCHPALISYVFHLYANCIWLACGFKDEVPIVVNAWSNQFNVGDELRI